MISREFSKSWNVFKFGKKGNSKIKKEKKSKQIVSKTAFPTKYVADCKEKGRRFGALVSTAPIVQLI